MQREDTRRGKYQSYLLRLWRSDEEQGWHASLQSTATERVYRFGTLEALFAFLNAQPPEDNDAASPNAPE